MKAEKDFDSVEMMRELRRAVDQKLDGKTFEEQRRLLDESARSWREQRASTEPPSDV